jgi:hypothetical protein
MAPPFRPLQQPRKMVVPSDFGSESRFRQIQRKGFLFSKMTAKGIHEVKSLPDYGAGSDQNKMYLEMSSSSGMEVWALIVKTLSTDRYLISSLGSEWKGNSNRQNDG